MYCMKPLMVILPLAAIALVGRRPKST
jgi:hypothetical protein